MKKLLCPLFALLIVLSLSTAAFAADYSTEESANALYELGLFQGTGETANGKLSEVMREIGWDAAKQTFRSYPDTTNLTPEENFTLFISLLSQYSGKDVRAMFTDTEWANAMKVGSL